MDVFLEYLRAFVCGGILCAIGQILIDKTPLTPAKILVTYVVSGVVLGALGIYKYIVAFGGAGATVPLTGFGYLLGKGAIDAVAAVTPAFSARSCRFLVFLWYAIVVSTPDDCFYFYYTKKRRRCQ